MKLEQWTNDTGYVVFAHHFQSNWTMWKEDATNPWPRWLGGYKPVDKVRREKEVKVLPTAIAIIVSILSLFGCGGIFMAGGFAVTRRQLPCLVDSVAPLNFVLLAGCFLANMSIIFLAANSSMQPPSWRPTLFPIFCRITSYLLSMGFSAAFGGLFAKIWLVRANSTANPKRPRIVTVSPALAWFLAFLCLADVVINIVWQFQDPIRFDKSVLPPIPQSEDLLIVPVVQFCSCSNVNFWLGLLIGSKALLVLFTVFLSYETSSVKVKSINDARFARMAIYNIAVLSVVTVPVLLLVRDRPLASFGFLSAATLVSTTTTLGLIFVPKLLNSTVERGKTDVVEDEDETLELMIKENDKVKKLIAEKEERIAELRHRMRVRSDIPSQVTDSAYVSGRPLTMTDVSDD